MERVCDVVRCVFFLLLVFLLFCVGVRWCVPVFLLIF